MPAAKKGRPQIKVASLSQPEQRPLAPHTPSSAAQEETSNIPQGETGRVRPHLRTFGVRSVRCVKTFPNTPPREVLSSVDSADRALVDEWVQQAPAGMSRFLCPPHPEESSPHAAACQMEIRRLAGTAGKLALCFGFSEVRIMAVTEASASAAYWRTRGGTLGTAAAQRMDLADLLDLQ